MSDLVRAQIGSIIRHILTLGAGYFVAQGYLTESAATELAASGSVFLATIIWSLYQNTRVNRKVDVALAMPEGATKHDLKVVMDELS